MRVDGRDAGIDHLKVRLRIPVCQQRLQIPRRRVIWIRLAAGRRLPQDEYAIGVYRFLGLEHQRLGPTRQGRWKKAQAEIFVVDEIITVADMDFFEKGGVIAKTRQPQNPFKGAQEEERQANQRHQAVKPFPRR